MNKVASTKAVYIPRRIFNSYKNDSADTRCSLNVLCERDLLCMDPGQGHYIVTMRELYGNTSMYK